VSGTGPLAGDREGDGGDIRAEMRAAAEALGHEPARGTGRMTSDLSRSSCSTPSAGSRSNW